MARCSLRKNSVFSELDLYFEKIQSELFNIGSLLGCADEAILPTLPQISESHIIALESQIDQLSNQLPELKNFILPAGHESAALLHVARTICRRAERRAAEVAITSPSHHQCLIYLNRLSDLLFVAARWVNLQNNHEEVLWKK